MRVPGLFVAATLALFLGAEPALAAPKPKLGKTALVRELAGTVTYIEKSETRIRPLTKPTLIPMGSAIDTRQGKVRIRTARKGRGLDEATFWQGAFGIRQDKQDAHPEAVLTGEIGGTGCGEGPSGSAGVPHLWASSDGAFRTVSRHSGVEASEPGTRWRVEDLCQGTRYFVRSGSVQAYDGPILILNVDEGQTLQNFCDHDGVEPVSRVFCTMLLFKPEFGLYGPGIVTLGDATSYEICVTHPSGEEHCDTYSLGEPINAEGYRDSVLGCSTEGGPGAYSIRWLIDGVQLGPAFGFSSLRPPGQDCIERGEL
jgi:hypothetical protein